MNERKVNIGLALLLLFFLLLVAATLLAGPFWLRASQEAAGGVAWMTGPLP